jgi:hypothetical protein
MEAQNSERRTQIEGKRSSIARRAFSIFVLSSALCVLRFFNGCAANAPPSTQPSTAEERQDAALNDPMNYKPQFGNGDISGGDIGHFDRDGFNRDMHDVLSP